MLTGWKTQPDILRLVITSFFPTMC